MYVYSQTFIVLRDMLTVDKVDVRSYKLHFDDLEYYKDDVFDFVSLVLCSLNVNTPDFYNYRITLMVSGYISLYPMRISLYLCYAR